MKTKRRKWFIAVGIVLTLLMACSASVLVSRESRERAFHAELIKIARSNGLTEGLPRHYSYVVGGFYRPQMSDEEWDRLADTIEAAAHKHGVPIGRGIRAQRNYEFNYFMGSTQWSAWFSRNDDSVPTSGASLLFYKHEYSWWDVALERFQESIGY